LGELFIKEVERKILLKEFEMAKYFPDTALVKAQTAVEKLKTADKVVTFGRYSKQWSKLMNGTLAYSTMRGYEYQIRKLSPIIGESTDISKITYSDIQEVVSKLRKGGMKVKTIRNAIGVLNSLFNAAFKDGVVKTNPAAGVIIRNTRLAEEQEDDDADIDDKIFNSDEVKAILDYVSIHYPKMALLFAIGFYTGARTGEILALRWSDFDLTEKKIKISKTRTAKKLKMSTKTGKARNIQILPVLEPFIEKHKQYITFKDRFLTPDGDLFLNNLNEPYKGMDGLVRMFWKPTLKALNLKYRRPYDMRHTFSCMMIDAGENLKWIASMLGHKDLTMLLKIYGNKINKQEGGQKFMAQFSQDK
jgi:integrase